MKILSFQEFLYEQLIQEAEGGGEAAGKLELVKISVEQAEKFLKEQYEKSKFNYEDEIEDFVKRFEFAKNQATRLGKTKRKEMPVINNEDVKNFQRRLEQGKIDIKNPWSPTTKDNKPFPEGLRGTDAQDFLERGLKDTSKKDDKIVVRIQQKSIKDLRPIQKQIYFDKSLGMTAKFGVKSSSDFLQKQSFFVTSSDNFIIDGHHRWLSGCIIDPEMKVNCLDIDLEISKLLPLAKAYGDAIGNKRNESIDSKMYNCNMEDMVKKSL